MFGSRAGRRIVSLIATYIGVNAMNAVTNAVDDPRVVTQTEAEADEREEPQAV